MRPTKQVYTDYTEHDFLVWKTLFDRRRQSFSLPLSIEGTEFQKTVWNKLLTIPYGRTVSYLEMAKKLGNRNSIRAVGNANAKNRIAIIIPCHRVIGNKGDLTGYAGGIQRKKWLNEFEQGNVQGSLFS